MHKNGQENDMPEASQAHNELFPQGLIVSQNIVFLKFMIKYKFIITVIWSSNIPI